MKKITDRFLLGIIAGLGGNVAKCPLETAFVKWGDYKSTGKQKAAGIFLKKSDIDTPYGSAVGAIGDYLIAAGLGISCCYFLTFMGRDKYLLKGAALGAAEWTALYGVMSRLGATAIFPIKPKDALIAFLAHCVFGITKMAIVANLGDSRLFQPGNLTERIGQPEEVNFFRKKAMSGRTPASSTHASGERGRI